MRSLVSWSTRRRCIARSTSARACDLSAAAACVSCSTERSSVASGVCGSSGVGTPQKTSRRFVTRLSTNSGSSGPSAGQRAIESTIDVSSDGSSSSRKARRSVAKDAEQLGAKKPPTRPGRHLVELVKSA